jgi:hypothetical protein
MNRCGLSEQARAALRASADSRKTTVLLAAWREQQRIQGDREVEDGIGRVAPAVPEAEAMGRQLGSEFGSVTL